MYTIRILVKHSLWGFSSVVERALCMREATGPIPVSSRKRGGCLSMVPLSRCGWILQAVELEVCRTRLMAVERIGSVRRYLDSLILGSWCVHFLNAIRLHWQ